MHKSEIEQLDVLFEYANSTVNSTVTVPTHLFVKLMTEWNQQSLDLTSTCRSINNLADQIDVIISKLVLEELPTEGSC